MNSELVTQIFEICIVPILAILTRYIISFLKAKSTEIVKNTDNVMVEKYVNLINDTITNCVIATNQTYVESLKKQGKFDEAAQEKAFQDTFNAVVKILSEDAKEYIRETTGDINTFLIQKIEATVKFQK